MLFISCFIWIQIFKALFCERLATLSLLSIADDKIVGWIWDLFYFSFFVWSISWNSCLQLFLLRIFCSKWWELKFSSTLIIDTFDLLGKACTLRSLQLFIVLIGLNFRSSSATILILQTTSSRLRSFLWRRFSSSRVWRSHSLGM